MGKEFSSLALEKQNAIINAGLQVFSKESYKTALTDDIASLAGISKGLLFYYFKNKKEFYVYLYDYGCKFIYDNMKAQGSLETDDFFELFTHSMKRKLEIFDQYPYLYSFLLKAYYETNDDIKGSISFENLKWLTDIKANYIEKLNMLKFRDGVDPMKVYQLLYWAAEGFMRECLEKDEMNRESITSQFTEYLMLLKQGFYKSEYLQEESI